MKSILKKTSRFVVRSALSLCALIIVLLAIFQITLVIGINLFNTGKTHDFIQTQINTVILDSGYKITFDKFFYDPVRGFTIYDLNLSDVQGPILDMDRFSLAVAFSQIPLRQLNLQATAGNITLFRIPKSDTPESGSSDTATLKPFTTPDIFFTAISIERFSINALTLGENIAGTPMTFSPSLKASLSLGETIDAKISIFPHAKTTMGAVAFPEKAFLEALFTPASLNLDLKNFEISSPDYSLNAAGNGQFTPNGTVDFKLNASYPDLKPLTGENLESATLAIDVTGNYIAPVLMTEGTIIPATLKDRGLGDIKIKASAKDILAALQGDISIDTLYQNQPISIKSNVAYNTPNLTIHSLEGTAPDITLSAKGFLSTQTMLFDGNADISATDLSHYKDLLAVDLGGKIKANAVLKPVEAAQSLILTSTIDNASYDKIRVRKIDLNAGLSDIAASIWPQTATLKVQDLVLSETLSLKKTDATIKRVDKETYKLSLDGNGKFPDAFSFSGGADLSSLINPIPDAHNIGLDIKLGQSSAHLKGGFTPAKLDLAIGTKNFRATDIPGSLPDALKNVQFSGDIGMTGTPAAPVTTAEFSATGIDTGKYNGLTLNLVAKHQDSTATAALSGKGTGIRALNATTTIPLSFSLIPFSFDLDQASAISGKFLADLDLASITVLFLPPTQKFNGALKADGTISGTLSSPDAAGNIILRNGNFTDDGNGIQIADIKADASFTKDTLALRTLTATDGEAGKLNGYGNISFGAASFADIKIKAEKFHLPKSNLANGILDANLTLNQSTNGYAASGVIDVEEMNVLIPETFQSKIPELNIVERKKTDEDHPAKSLSLGIKINAPNQVFVRGWGLDAEFGGQVDISGFADAPQFNGSLSSKRGRYEEFGKRFNLERANLRFQGELPPSPYLDIEATTPAGDVVASILLTGPVKSPAIGFSSTPALPDDEVLARILFGRDTTKITPFQAVQLAQTLQRFSGKSGGGFDPLGMIRSATGIDDISIDTDESGETNVGVGKYLTDDVYLEFEKGKAENSGAASIQIELTPSINIESKIGQDAQTGGGIMWKRDY